MQTPWSFTLSCHLVTDSQHLNIWQRRKAGEQEVRAATSFVLHKSSMLLNLSAICRDAEKGAHPDEKVRAAGGSPVFILCHSFNKHRARQVFQEREKVSFPARKWVGGGGAEI